MRLTIQTATIQRTYRKGDTAERRVTLNGREDGSAFTIGETLPAWHHWAGWQITATHDCGEINN